MLRSLGALLFLIALLIGVPALLIGAVGNPLPESAPTVDELRILLTQTGQGFTNLIIGTLAVIIWLVWAQLVIALLVEVVAVSRHAQTPHLPTLPGIQRLAAGLVAALTLAVTLTAAPLLASSAGALHFEDLPAARAMHKAPSDTIVVDLTESAAEQPMLALEVHDHTELWDVADAAYGDGMSWKLIAAMNAGRTDSAGEPITSDTAAVGPGTVLRLPGVVDEQAVTLHGTIDGSQSEVDSAHEIVRGDSMWTVAQSELERQLGRSATQAEVGEYWAELVELNRDVPSGNIDLIYPGDALALPEAAGDVATPPLPPLPPEPAGEPGLEGVVDGPADNRNRVPQATQESAEVAQSAIEPEPVPELQLPADLEREVQPEQEAQPELEQEDNQTYQPYGLAGLGAAVLAAGVVGALRRRRDRQRRTRPAAAMAARSSSVSAAFEAALLQSSSEVRESNLGAGWQVMPAAAVEAARSAGSLQFHAEESGRIRAVAVVDDEQASEVRQVHFDVADAVDDVAESLSTVAPTSLLVGTECATGDAVFLDLQSSGCVEIVGDCAAVQRFARTAVLDLALSDRAEDLFVIAVGVAGELADLERVSPVETMEDAVLVATRSGHAAADSSTSIVVVSAVAPLEDTNSENALRELGASLLGPHAGAPMRVVLDGDLATLSPAGTKVELVALDDRDFACVVELVDNSNPATMAQGELIAPTSAVTQAGPVEVKILGSVQVAGAKSFSSLKAVDVITYLAFHRNGADADQIKSWVWPAYEPPTDKAFANVMSRARRGLGAADDGSPYLSRAGADRTYRLSSVVTTDFDRFQAIVEQAEQAATPHATVSVLSEALELIRGVPFTGGGASSFVWADNHVRAQVEFAIDEAVHRCADLSLEIDDLDTARWAALKGLELVPGCEQCFRRRFLVASAGQNRSELRRAMADLERSAAADLGEPEGVDLISGDLLELYHQLDQTLVAGGS